MRQDFQNRCRSRSIRFKTLVFRLVYSCRTECGNGTQRCFNAESCEAGHMRLVFEGPSARGIRACGLLSLLFLTPGIAALAQMAKPSATAREVLEAYRRMDLAGERLTADGWYRTSKFFVRDPDRGHGILLWKSSGVKFLRISQRSMATESRYRVGVRRRAGSILRGVSRFLYPHLRTPRAVSQNSVGEGRYAGRMHRWAGSTI